MAPPQDEAKPAEGSAPSANPAASAKAADVEEYPDPDEDDLDDLDDMLDDFSTVKLDPKAPEKHAATNQASAAAAGTSKAATTDADLDPDDMPFNEEDFAKQIQAGMADMLGEFEKSPEMQAQFEELLKQFGAAAAGAEPDTRQQPGGDGAGKEKEVDDDGGDPDASFQEKIRRTMERMQTSGDQATAAASAGQADDFMSEMLKQLGGELGAGGEASEGDITKLLMDMMEQLTNKDILYEPMKELHEKFPGWMDKNEDKTSAEDMVRYKEQQGIVAEIVAKFEEPKYSDSNPSDREYIVDRMQKMQAAGSPPEDLVGDMAAAQELFNAPDQSCNPQ